MSARDVEFLLDILIGRKTLPTAVQDSSTAIERERVPVMFACATPQSLVVAQHDDGFQSALTRADFICCYRRGWGGVLLRFYGHLGKGHNGPGWVSWHNGGCFQRSTRVSRRKRQPELTCLL